MMPCHLFGKICLYLFDERQCVLLSNFLRRILLVILHGKNIFSVSHFFSLDEIPKIKICHMLAEENPEVIEGTRRLIAVDVLDYEEAAEGASIDHDGAASDEEDESGLVGAGVTEEVEDIQKAFKSTSLSSYMLKPSHLLSQGFKKNRTAHEKLFKHICNFGA